MLNPIEIRARLAALELNRPTVADQFSRRLARENGWSHSHAERVTLEYKRFLLLAGTASELVSPSDAVDQAWHLHLIHTRDYRRVCRSIFGRRLDHNPSEGGFEERKKYAAAYARTLELYRETFDEEAPGDIWPRLEERFDGESEYVRLDVRAHWVVQKPELLRLISTRLAERSLLPPKPVAVVAALVSTGCVVSTSPSVKLTGPQFFGWFLVGWAASLVLALVAQRTVRRSAEAALPATELDPYETAYLAGRGTAAVDAAVAVLVASGAAEFDEVNGTLVATAPPAPYAYPLEKLVHAELSSDAPVALASIRARAEDMTADVFERLERRGLAARHPSALPLALALTVPLVGIARIVSRIGTGHPVGGLVLCSVLGLVLAFVAFRPSFRTREGEKLLKELRQRHTALSKEPSTPELLAFGTLPLAVGLFGVGLFASSPELQGLHGWFRRSAESGGGGGCGGGCSAGGCGGGGCGGGCGGCGGCGGE